MRDAYCVSGMLLEEAEESGLRSFDYAQDKLDGLENFG